MKRDLLHRIADEHGLHPTEADIDREGGDPEPGGPPAARVPDPGRRAANDGSDYLCRPGRPVAAIRPRNLDKEWRHPMRVFQRMGEHNYEKLVFCNDNDSGLRAIVAIHDTTLGPALGGIRMLPYATEEEALEDVLRLARGMTQKAAVGGVDLGGGKSVIIGDSRTDKNPALLRTMGRFVDTMAGEYIAGQDIGTNSHDMAVIRGATKHVACVNESAGGGGDPSRTTAYGVSCGIRAVLKAVNGSDSIGGRHIAIQGLGNVGFALARFCHEAGARLTVSEIHEPRAAKAAKELGAEVVGAEAIYDVPCDVFSPNSVGGIVNDDTLPRLRCKAVVGGANNILAEPRHGDELGRRGIVYAPDYLVNSGGLIRCQEEVFGRPIEDFTIYSKVTQIYDRTLHVIKLAEELGISTAAAADWMAEERIASAR